MDTHILDITWKKKEEEEEGEEDEEEKDEEQTLSVSRPAAKMIGGRIMMKNMLRLKETIDSSCWSWKT